MSKMSILAVSVVILALFLPDLLPSDVAAKNGGVEDCTNARVVTLCPPTATQVQCPHSLASVIAGTTFYLNPIQPPGVANCSNYLVNGTPCGARPGVAGTWICVGNPDLPPQPD